MKVLDNAKLSSVSGGRFLVMPRVFYKPEWQKWLDILIGQAAFLKRGRLKVGFDFVETMLSDGLCLISDGKGGDCLWANVFQLSAFYFFSQKPKASAQSALSYLRHHEDVACRQPISATTIGQAFCRCARTAEGKACVSRGVPLARARYLKFYTRVRGYATHPVYDYTNFETNAEGDCGTYAAVCLSSSPSSKKQPALRFLKVQAAFLWCGVFGYQELYFGC